MSTKKRFSISPDLANGLRNSIQSAAKNQGQLHYDMMSLDIIEPDVNNPRKLSLSREEILKGPNTEALQDPRKQKDHEALVELSQSIKRIGIKNAIEVFKDGLTYRIITGERRYWAATLAGLKSVPVRISQRPDEFNLRYTQWAENINRQDLSLWEKHNNLVLIANAYQQFNQAEFTEQALQQLLGVSVSQAYRYYCLLKANEKITQLIKLSKLNNLKLVQELVVMKDKSACQQIVAWIAASKQEVTSLAHYRIMAGKRAQQAPREKGKPLLSLGKVNNVNVAKKLLAIVLADPHLEHYRARFNDIDWGSSKNVTKTFKALYQAIETAFETEIA